MIVEREMNFRNLYFQDIVDSPVYLRVDAENLHVATDAGDDILSVDTGFCSDLTSSTTRLINYPFLVFFLFSLVTSCLAFIDVCTLSEEEELAYLFSAMCDLHSCKRWAHSNAKRFRFSTTFCIPISGVSAVYDGVSAYRKRLALECARYLLIAEKLNKKLS